MFQADFIVRNIDLNWADILWGYRHQMIGWRVPIEIAKSRIMKPPFDTLETQLANVGKDQDWSVDEIVETLALRNPTLEDQSPRRWMFLTLLWLYENKDHIENVFGALEEVYADFDYPEEICSFAPIHPWENGYDPSAHTTEENQKRWLRNWKEYLNTTRLGIHGTS